MVVRQARDEVGDVAALDGTRHRAGVGQVGREHLVRRQHFLGMPADEPHPFRVLGQKPGEIAADHAAGAEDDLHVPLRIVPGLILFVAEIAESCQPGVASRPPLSPGCAIVSLRYCGKCTENWTSSQSGVQLASKYVNCSRSFFPPRP